MNIKYSKDIEWFYLDKEIHIIQKITKNVISLRGQDLDFWLEIDRNQNYSIILLNLSAQIDLDKIHVKSLFDEFLNNMITRSILYLEN